MKCAVCKYENNNGWDYENQCVIERNKEFIESNFSVQVSYDYHNEEKKVYACPKCGTLKIDI